MGSDLYNQIVSQRGALENLIAKIPGFKGYHEKNARRQADRMIREYLGQQFDAAIDRFARIERKILDAGGLQHMSKTREVKDKMQAYTEKVKMAAPKYSSMFEEIKIDNDALDRIYAFDQAQIQYVDKFEAALDTLENAVKAQEDFGDALDAVYDVVAEAAEVFDMRDDEILRLGERL